MTEDTKKAELLTNTFELVSTNTSPLTQGTRIKECWKGDFPLFREDWNREQLYKLDNFKSMHPDRMHPSMLRYLMDTMISL